MKTFFSTHRWSRLLAPILLAVLLLTGGIGALAVTNSGITGYGLTRTLYAGTVPYTTTTTSSAVAVDGYGAVQLSAVAAVSGTTAMTLTPQYSLFPGICEDVPESTWTDAAARDISPASLREIVVTAQDVATAQATGSAQAVATVQAVATTQATAVAVATLQVTEGQTTTTWITNTITLTGTHTTTTGITTTNALTNTTDITNTTTLVSADNGLPVLTESSLSRAFAIAGNGAAQREIPTQGRCMRIVITSNSSVFTPTLYLRAVNRQ